MDLSYSRDYEIFRSEVRAFLRENWAGPTRDRGRRAEAARVFRQAAVEAGYLYRSVPKIYGGSEQAADVLKAQIIREEFERVRAPRELDGVGVTLLTPTLLEHGTEAQKSYFIPRTLSGEFAWAQGYSEPSAGSDLASLRTRGELKGDTWVVNGQKIWSSGAHLARFMFVLVRTEPTAPKHAGISYLLVDLKQPGIEVRPLKQMTGGSEFCEVFFNDATTPADWIVGERGKGWTVTRSTLKHERNFIGGVDRIAKPFERLVELAKRTTIDGAPAIKDAEIRQRLAKIAGSVAAMTYSSYRQTSLAARGEDPGLIQLLFKLGGSNIGHEVAQCARELMGDSFLLAPIADGTRSDGVEKWNQQFMGSLAVAIAGGASNIQRNIIAERGLGLPRSGD
jgi:alkylation response protein AidB-like acyl-CoA dehydrogenase